MNIFNGQYQGKQIKVAIVIARFNELVTHKLLTGAQDNLLRHGVADRDIDVYWVPGAFEIPFVTKKVATSEKYDGVITLGAVVRGETTHYELVSSEVAKGIATIELHAKVPVMFGVLTTETIEQALQRAGSRVGNKGNEPARGLLEMVSLNQQL